jgi:predicted MFS family arabinose efflux permease
VKQSRWRLVIICGIYELLSWGALYYTVPVLHDRIHDDTRWSMQLLALTYSSALVLAALLGPKVGAIVDREGPRRLATFGAAAGALGLCVVATAPSIWVQAAGMLLVGAAQSATLYPPVFSALTIWFESDKARALTVVSLFGGASSTLFAPSLAPLVAHLEWRGALLVVAALFAITAVPLAWWGMSDPWDQPSNHREATAAHSVHVKHVAKSLRFRCLQVSLMLAGVGLYATTLNLIPLARQEGYSFGFAATVFGLVGLGQVGGRLLYVPLAGRGSPRAQTVVQVASASLAVLAIAASAAHPAALICAAILAGGVRGAHTLVMASGVSDRWGTVGFGRLSGTFNRPVALAIAASPFVGTAVAGATGSYASAAAILGSLAAVGALFARAT